MFLDHGLDIEVHLSGPKKTVVTLKYILFDAVWAHKFNKEFKVPSTARDFGFKKMVMTDGHDYSVYWKL